MKRRIPVHHLFWPQAAASARAMNRADAFLMTTFSWQQIDAPNIGRSGHDERSAPPPCARDVALS
jgi:hypothetical protein